MMNHRHLLTAWAAGFALSATGLVPHGFAQPGAKIPHPGWVFWPATMSILTHVCSPTR
jgi:hypothetical protein